MVSIHGWPPEIEERRILGQWEGGFIKGTHVCTATGTLVEQRHVLSWSGNQQNRGLLADPYDPWQY